MHTYTLELDNGHRSTIEANGFKIEDGFVQFYTANDKNEWAKKDYFFVVSARDVHSVSKPDITGE